MSTTALYLGDSALDGAARYLAGVLDHHGIGFDHLPSGQPFVDDLLERGHGVIAISDYPARNFTDDQLSRIRDAVAAGLGLVMIGGWSSFVGLGGGYQRTVLREVLPVELGAADDRRNNWGPCVVAPAASHPILDGLDLTGSLPCVCGFNELAARPDATTVLTVKVFEARPAAEEIAWVPRAEHPLLVVGRYGEGSTACFASDVAPHWVGGLVDWGAERISAAAPGAGEIEVGDSYALLFANLIRWAAGPLDKQNWTSI